MVENSVLRNYCKQCERFVHEEEVSHLTAFPNHVLVEYSVGQSYADASGNLPGQKVEIPRVLNYSYYDMNSSSKSYTAKTYILFPGHSLIGTPTKIEVIAKSSSKSSKAAQVRIYDVTNNKVIAEKYVSTDRPEVVDLGELGNISSESAVWELQMKKIESKVYCYALNVKF
ncbi:MAG: hypothetical protein DRQ40_00430 [Gammaproteobacteria bacterium]|nr:MAG: hypothetical protein DRQ40_00430 [Gammaproteobacteria bacterium]